MKKLSLFILMICLVSIVLAAQQLADKAWQELRKNHEKMIYKLNDVSFLAGEHSWTMLYHTPTSVFTLKKAKCIYAEWGDKKLYRIITAEYKEPPEAASFEEDNPEDDIVKLNFCDRLILDNQVKLLDYSISLIHNSHQSGYTLILPNNLAEQKELYTIWSEYAKMIHQNFIHYPVTHKIWDSLQIVGPDMQMYEQLFSTTFDPTDRSLIDKYVSFYFEWRVAEWPPKQNLYEMPYPIICFSQLQVESTQNLIGVVVKASIPSPQLGMVEVTSASWGGTPYGFIVRGHVTFTLQKP